MFMLPSSITLQLEGSQSQTAVSAYTCGKCTTVFNEYQLVGSYPAIAEEGIPAVLITASDLGWVFYILLFCYLVLLVICRFLKLEITSPMYGDNLLLTHDNELSPEGWKKTT